MEGETFETEDQRNWSDASFKTYGTPLALPLPVEVTSGHAHPAVGHALPVRRTRASPSRGRRRPAGALPSGAASSSRWSSLRTRRRLPRPALGLAGAGLVSLGGRRAERLRALQLEHLRADLHLETKEWGAALERAVANARRLACRSSWRSSSRTTAAARCASSWRAPWRSRPRVASWLVFERLDRTTRTASRRRPARRSRRSTPGRSSAAARTRTSSSSTDDGRRRPARSDLVRADAAGARLGRRHPGREPRQPAVARRDRCAASRPGRSRSRRSACGRASSRGRPRAHEPGEPPFTDDPRQDAPSPPRGPSA